MIDDQRFGCIVLGIIQTDAKTCAIKFPPIIAAIRTLAAEKPIIFAGLDDGAEVPAEFLGAIARTWRALFPLAGPRLSRHRSHLCGACMCRGRQPRRCGGLPPLPLNPGVIAEYKSKDTYSSPSESLSRAGVWSSRSTPRSKLRRSSATRWS